MLLHWQLFLFFAGTFPGNNRADMAPQRKTMADPTGLWGGNVLNPFERDADERERRRTRREILPRAPRRRQHKGAERR